MPKLRVHNTISFDGFAAGPRQREDAPFGDGFDGVQQRMLATMADRVKGRPNADVDFLERSERNIGATIMGRNMFGPQRGPWEDESWTGWWGPEPPFHHDVFVLTRHLRPAVRMEGGTTFHFTDEPIEKVLELAFAAADGQDVRVAGGPSTVQQYMRAGLVDEVHLTVVPVMVGAGERLLDNLGEAAHSYQVAELVGTPASVHAQLTRV
ncbi:dihydrofolate reductase family protein [Streptomyces sp. Da 82-17]|uniref:dihydrofolate reductase family protein n=1 Tax=Streptomyces sp. Da 82-17 TaxID=3377116 RepID=UPI0038D4E846